jgi:hypothetical protein
MAISTTLIRIGKAIVHAAVAVHRFFRNPFRPLTNALGPWGKTIFYGTICLSAGFFIYLDPFDRVDKVLHKVTIVLSKVEDLIKRRQAVIVAAPSRYENWPDRMPPLAMPKNEPVREVATVTPIAKPGDRAVASKEKGYKGAQSQSPPPKSTLPKSAPPPFDTTVTRDASRDPEGKMGNKKEGKWPIDDLFEGLEKLFKARQAPPPKQAPEYPTPPDDRMLRFQGGN